MLLRNDLLLVTAQAVPLEILLAICYNENRRNTQCWGGQTADHSGVVRDPNRSESLGKRSVCQPHGSASEGLSLRFRFCRTPSDPDPVFANRTTGRQKMAAVGVCRGQRGAVFQFALNEMVFPDTGIRFRFSARTAVDQQLHTQRGPVGFIAVAFAFSLS